MTAKDYDYKKTAYILMANMLILYILQNIGPKIISQWLNKPLHQWLIWGGFIFTFIRCVPKMHSIGKLTDRSHLLLWSFNIGAAFILTHLLAGILFGFGKSPYDHSLSGILINLLSVGIPLLGREIIRNYSINTLCVKHNTKWFVLIILLMTLTQISFSKWLGITSLEKFTILCAEQLLPRLFENILASYLVMYGGVSCSIIFLGMITGFEWLSPILPDIDWLMKAIIGMAVPVGGTLFILKGYLKLTNHKKVREEEQENIWAFIPTAIVCVAIVWFTVGVFPIYPSAIATGSMEPMIKAGDVILAEKVKSQEQLEQLQVGDIIQFRRDDILITHRIVEILEIDGLKEYRTKGDNNSVEDSRLVKMEEVKGIYRNVIPKIGWPTLLFKSRNSIAVDQVEF